MAYHPQQRQLAAETLALYLHVYHGVSGQEAAEVRWVGRGWVLKGLGLSGGGCAQGVFGCLQRRACKQLAPQAGSAC